MDLQAKVELHFPFTQCKGPTCYEDFSSDWNLVLADHCGNCGEEITAGGFLKGPNPRLEKRMIDFINFMKFKNFDDLCYKCGHPLFVESKQDFVDKKKSIEDRVSEKISDFPMMTVGNLPFATVVQYIGMVTSNISVGTGIFNEFSQGLSDIFGRVNSQTGMAAKVNRGEAAARSILVAKALAVGANCVLGVDIDYGTTANNAATVNMQGTAVFIVNLIEVLKPDPYDRAMALFEEIEELRKFSELRPIETFDV